MKNSLLKNSLFIALLLLSFKSFSQEKDEINMSSKTGYMSYGLGLGLPYGGVGLRVGTNVAKNFNVFGGLGYQFADVGYTIGVLKSFSSRKLTDFYISGMYGTNAGIIIKGSSLSAIYRGPSFGCGVKVNSKKREGNFWDFGLIFPIRSQEYYDYVDFLNRSPNVVIYSEPPPLLVVVAYNFAL